jgi:hypothetical protein
MDSRSLQHMYQAWAQGQEDATRDWVNFVEWAAKWNNTTGDNIMRILQTTYWFKKPTE